jgi:hypothetical protein
MASEATIAEQERVNARAVAADAKYKEPVVAGEVHRGTRYPVQLFKNSSEADTKVAITKKLKDEDFGDVLITDRLVDYFYSKAEEEEFARRERWIAETFDATNPGTRAWLDKVNPGFFRRREQYAMQKLRDQERLIKMVFHGPTTEEDLDFIYHISTGRISIRDLMKQPWLQEDDAPNRTSDTTYVRGLFSPRRWTGAKGDRMPSDFAGGVLNLGSPNDKKINYFQDAAGNIHENRIGRNYNAMRRAVRDAPTGWDNQTDNQNNGTMQWIA